MLDEGARTLGVWLPLALADIKALLFALLRMWAAKPENVEVPSRSESLESWALPYLAASLKLAEAQQEKEELRARARVLQEKYSPAKAR